MTFSKPAALMTQEMMVSLREGGLPVSAIADAMSVERKTVYAWLDGGEARKDHAQRAAVVHSLLTGLPDIDARTLYRFWNTPVSGTQTLGDLMRADPIDEQLVRTTLQDLLPVARRARDSERKIARKGPGNPVLDALPEAGERA
jgi:hypothetical protein